MANELGPHPVMGWSTPESWTVPLTAAGPSGLWDPAGDTAVRCAEEKRDTDGVAPADAATAWGDCRGHGNQPDNPPKKCRKVGNFWKYMRYIMIIEPPSWKKKVLPLELFFWIGMCITSNYGGYMLFPVESHTWLGTPRSKWSFPAGKIIELLQQAMFDHQRVHHWV